MTTEDPFFAPFAAALLDPERPPPPGIETWNGSDPSVRLGVYRNNVVVSLVSALAETFPVTKAVIGEGSFQWLARRFIAASPPRSPVLSDYGEGFPSFLADVEPSEGARHLCDLARLELLRVRAYHAADAEPLSTAVLARHLERPELLPETRLGLHPSVRSLASSKAVVSLWASYQADGPVTVPELDRPESALIVRVGDEVLVLGVARPAAAFVAALARRSTLGEAAFAALEQDPSFDLTQGLALLIRHGAIVAWQPPGDPDR